VIAYGECGSPNRVHGGGLSAGACNPPQQSSPHLTVGTPDANGALSKSVGRVRATVLPGDPATTADEADVALEVSMTDVRRRTNLADYAGELQGVLSIQVTDRSNGSDPGSPPFDDPGTVTELPLAVTLPCAATPDGSVGSTCAVQAGVDAVVPGAVIEGKRAIWALGAVEVLDGGADGVAATADNSPFLRQGIFVP
jgi:hypothetical protein